MNECDHSRLSPRNNSWFIVKPTHLKLTINEHLGYFWARKLVFSLNNQSRNVLPIVISNIFRLLKGCPLITWPPPPLGNIF